MWIGLAEKQTLIECKSEALPPTTTLSVITSNSPIFRYLRPVILAIRLHLMQPLITETKKQILNAKKRCM
jgi:hypothetical protein